MTYIVEKWNKGEIYYQGIFGNGVAKDRKELMDFEPIGWVDKNEENFRPLNKKQVKELFEAELITEVTVEATNKAYKEYLADFFAEYTKNQANRTQEEIVGHGKPLKHSKGMVCFRIKENLYLLIDFLTFIIREKLVRVK